MMAAAHKVKCAICGEIFDLNKIQGVRHGARRYAHQECYPEGELVPLPEETPEYKSLKSLEAYIIKLFKIEFVTPKMKKQIKEYKDRIEKLKQDFDTLNNNEFDDEYSDY